MVPALAQLPAQTHAAVAAGVHCPSALVSLCGLLPLLLAWQLSWNSCASRWLRGPRPWRPTWLWCSCWCPASWSSAPDSGRRSRCARPVLQHHSWELSPEKVDLELCLSIPGLTVAGPPSWPHPIHLSWVGEVAPYTSPWGALVSYTPPSGGLVPCRLLRLWPREKTRRRRRM